MPVNRLPSGSFVCIERSELQVVINTLRDLGYRTVGPTVVDGAIVYRDLDSVSQLPQGIVDEQDGGTCRLRKSDHDSWFAYTNGPDSLKKFLFPPCDKLLESHRNDGKWEFSAAVPAAEPVAIIGARACDLKALEVQDRVFLHGPYVDQAYKQRREKLFVVGVNCSRSAPTCFCYSMKCGPGVTTSFDLALTEVENQFVIAVGTLNGGKVIATTNWSPCTLDQVERAKSITASLEEEFRKRAADQESAEKPEGPLQRTLDTHGLRELLLENLDHPHWREVGERCLACANCTMVCPTCFCMTVQEVSDLSGENVERHRVWDSCFTAEHSYMNTGAVRKTTMSRYRQWLTHKLSTWHDQYGVSGCVGCGRCITWCPVGIDLTQEVAAIRGNGQ